MQSFHDTDFSEFSQKIFDDVRAMSAGERGVSRLAYSKEESAVMDYLQGIGESLGLEIERDIAGNLWMTMAGKDRSLPVLVSGSHPDSVPEGGNFDGLAGIVAALCAVKYMRDAGIEPEQDIRVVCWRSEEVGLIGSKAVLGTLSEKDIGHSQRKDGRTVRECMIDCGIDPDALVQGKRYLDTDKMAAYLELHIEQGPRLDASEVRVGVVTGIRGNAIHRVVRCIGETAHSGAVDFEFRHDAVMATARLFNRMYEAWTAWLAQGHDLVYTNGVIKTPDSQRFNIIAGEVTFSMDIRTLSVKTRDAFYALFLDECRKIEAEHGVKFEFDPVFYIEPSVSDSGLVEHLVKSAEKADVPAIKMPSGAGHDAGDVGLAGVPMAMVFVANQNGSHNWQEAMKMEDFLAGVKVLTQAIVDYR